MRWPFAALLGSAFVVRQALAELTFTVKATRNGVAIPQSEIKIEPFEFGRGSVSQSTPARRAGRKSRRSNPIATSANWCGSVNSAPSGNQIKTIHASFQHPSCSQRSGMSLYPQAEANWVGIDGDTYKSALLQAGTLCTIDNSTADATHLAWWQWVPSGAYAITSLPGKTEILLSPDDWIEVTIDTASDTEAEITIANLSQQQVYTMHIGTGPTLARVDADWVVERPYFDGALAGFPTFTDVWFEEAYANLTSSSSSSLGILGAKQYQIPDLCASEEWDDTQEVSWSL
ncbi:248a7ba7-3a8b-47c4-a326-e4e733eb4534 [Thermothielavioides terrestris]|uniref:248a7ba7-3a8b-47c4-a326-e4e733eb4534 n=1 Tax=Thermothielavioides terrestris TaxID=2587410 RepID=A0A3S4CBR8_9PEZI|nr:248a7ba7-3a8b-47c4-a326-e4e733eb4534 [Thermothielavioides terrestris]